MKKLNTKDFVLISILIGLNVVLARLLSINAWNVKVGFAFITVFVGAYMYGPMGGAIVNGIGDLIGALLFPVGPYYPAFTLTAILVGIVFGLFIKKEYKLSSVVIACLINEIILSLFLNTYWISVLYNANFKALFLTRIIQCVVMSVVEILSIQLLSKSMPKLERKFNNEL